MKIKFLFILMKATVFIGCPSPTSDPVDEENTEEKTTDESQSFQWPLMYSRYQSVKGP